MDIFTAAYRAAAYRAAVYRAAVYRANGGRVVYYYADTLPEPPTKWMTLYKTARTKAARERQQAIRVKKLVRTLGI